MTAPPGVRAATAADAEAVARVYAPHVTDSFATFEESPPDAAEFAGRMASGPRLPWLVHVEDGVVTGFAYAAHHRVRSAYRWSVDCSVYLAPGATGRGIGGSLYTALIPVVASLGYVSAYAAIALPNDASVRLHARHGFAHLGTFRDVGFKLGAWRDVAWFHRLLVDPPPHPVEPRPWDGVLPA